MFRNIHMNIDGRTFLGAVLIAGYMILINRLIGRTAELPSSAAALVKDSLLVLGPAIGVIVGAIWRTNGSEERTREILAASATSGASPEVVASLLPGPSIAAPVAAGTEKGVKEAVGDLASAGLSIGLRDDAPTVVPSAAAYAGPELPDVATAPVPTPEEPTWTR